MKSHLEDSLLSGIASQWSPNHLMGGALGRVLLMYLSSCPSSH